MEYSIFNTKILIINSHLAHPSAHYINLRSMEIMSELYSMDKRIFQDSEPIENFKSYRYQRKLF